MRGRPPKKGLQPSWMLLRRMELLFAYDQARKAGEKHAAAVASAVLAFRTKYPLIPASGSEVRRVLADWRPRNQATGVIVTKPEPPNDIITLPDGRKARRGLTFGFGPRPRYPRINAKLNGNKN